MATPTKTPPKPPAVPTVADAEAVLADLERRKAVLLVAIAAPGTVFRDAASVNLCTGAGRARWLRTASPLAPLVQLPA